jgi:hypothetical protein
VDSRGGRVSRSRNYLDHGEALRAAGPPGRGAAPSPNNPAHTLVLRMPFLLPSFPVVDKPET